MPRLAPLSAAVATCCLALPVLAQNTTSGELPEVNIVSTRADLQGVAGSASEGIVTSKQLRTRPLLRAGDLMESVPGLVATQHAGEGKANQYFLRGFNLDHGTDFATYVDGVPVNLPTHGHGQGYTDLYFLIPELVDSVQYRKGPYYAEEGDFAAAGAARLRTVRRLPAPLGLLEVGGGHYRRALAAGSFGAGNGDLLLAAEQGHDDGPWTVAQHLRKTNLVGRYSQGSTDNGWSVGVTHYEARWISTDQIPQRAVDAGSLGRYDSLDPTSGGRTRRTGLTAEWAQSAGARKTRVNLWALRYSFDLFSNFSYATRGCDAEPLPPQCNSSTALDQFEQVDRRTALGLSASHSEPAQWAGLDTVWTVGTDLRRDHIGEVGLYDTQARARLATVRSDRVRLDALGLWGQADLQLTPRLRGIAGLRWDLRRIDVNSSVAANSGHERAAIFSPKASLVYTLSERADLYANWGRGFHSNDARGTVIRVDPRDGVTPVDRATPLVRATGYEVGTRQKWSPQLSTTAALWALNLDSELLFVGDAGTTEPSRPSRRTGIELTANWRPASSWEIDADVSLSRPRFRDADPAGNRIPGALDRVITLGATWASGPWTLGARLRHFGPSALIEDNAIRGAASTLVNVKAAWRINRQTEISLDLFNLFNRQVNDISYAYASRLPGEPAFNDSTTAPTTHFHPSLPRTARVALKVYF
ncbi:MAG: TonB-dependent receptor [Ramlibacter sp.]|nr:TonB-dependent receptor [Ramlibacter sp.]